jgi:hypothetical protein
MSVASTTGNVPGTPNEKDGLVDAAGSHEG